MPRLRSIITVGLATALVCMLGVTPSAFAGRKGQAPNRAGDHQKLDRKLNDRSTKSGTSRVIVTLKPGWNEKSAELGKHGAKLGRRLALINGQVVELSNDKLRRLADHPAVASIHWDRPTRGQMNYAAVTVGARAVRTHMGLTGAGVGVAVIDSGIASWHDDLTYNGSSSAVQMKNSQRVPAFVDFVAGRLTPYDDNGHGTHVSGIIAGNGYDSYGARAGIAPSAHIVSLKVLDAQGLGVISNVIAALDWAVANRTAYNIRVINLSVGASVTESYMTDPLTLAARRAVDAGIVVVTAAGNLGKNSLGKTQYGAITAPGNAPWVLTVGASSHQGTIARYDDIIASFSSRGPTAIDYEAKPDIVAPGTGLVSMLAPGSTFSVTKANYLLKGSLWSLPLGNRKYLSLSGTSMASPVVAGSVALMLQANPALTPNLVKAILQYTAEFDSDYNAMTQGAGFLNTKGAVQLARFYATAVPGQRIRPAYSWSRKFNWGSHRIGGGVIKPNAPAWKLGVTWGAATSEDDNIVWGTLCGTECDNIVWGTADEDDNIVWGTATGEDDNIVWGTFAGEDDNIVWGTLAEDDNIVWGTDCGGNDCFNIVWGTATGEDDNIVWGTAEDDNIVWGTATGEDDNIVWGTSGEVDNIVWGTSADADVTWGSSGEETPLFDDPETEPSLFDSGVLDDLEITPLPTVTAPTTSGILGGVL